MTASKRVPYPQRLRRWLYEHTKTVGVALAFGLVLTGLETYPNDHDLEIFLAGSAAFLIISALLRRPQAKTRWVRYGLATVLCYLVPLFWFWYGAMTYGWWYPPQPPIIQHVYFVDGESGYDAAVTNLFLLLWVMVSVAFALYYFKAQRD